MNIFLMELKAHLRGTIFWCLGIAAFLGASFSKMSVLTSGSADINKIMDVYPKSLKAIFGIGNFDLSTVIGFFGILYIFIQLMLGLHAAMLGANIIAKEERDKTSEFLLTKPVSRRRILTAKLAAGVLIMVLLWAVAWLVSHAVLVNYDSTAGGDLAVLYSGVLLFQLVYFGIGFAIAGISKSVKKAGAISTSLLFADFALAMVSQVNPNLKFLGYLTPFRYFTAEKVISDGSWNVVVVLAAILLAVVGVVLAYLRYPRRDAAI